MHNEIIHAQQNVIHIDHIIEQQRRFASGARILEKVNILKLVNNAVDLCQQQLETAEMVIDVHPDLEWHVQRHRLLQVLVNLIVNAVEAMSDQTTNRLLTVHAEVFDACLILNVMDTGPGISPEVERLMFSSGFTTKPRGSGIGLHYCAINVQFMNGSIENIPSEESGAHFRITLPDHQTPEQLDPGSTINQA